MMKKPRMLFGIGCLSFFLVCFLLYLFAAFGPTGQSTILRQAPEARKRLAADLAIPPVPQNSLAFSSKTSMSEASPLKAVEAERAKTTSKDEKFWYSLEKLNTQAWLAPLARSGVRFCANTRPFVLSHDSNKRPFISSPSKPPTIRDLEFPTSEELMKRLGNEMAQDYRLLDNMFASNTLHDSKTFHSLLDQAETFLLKIAENGADPVTGEETDQQNFWDISHHLLARLAIIRALAEGNQNEATLLLDRYLRCEEIMHRSKLLRQRFNTSILWHLLSSTLYFVGTQPDFPTASLAQAAETLRGFAMNEQQLKDLRVAYVAEWQPQIDADFDQNFGEHPKFKRLA